MSLKQILANQTAKQLRFAVLRPSSECANTLLTRIKDMIGSKPSDEELARLVSEAAGDRLTFVGYIKAHSVQLYDQNGFAVGETIREGDIFQSIEEFNAALDVGGIVVERGITT